MTPDWSQRRIGTGSGVDGLGVTVHELDSGVAGPTVLVLGGVHGNEVGGIVAAGQLAQTRWPLRAGRLRVVPVTYEAAYYADSRVGPGDGLNLARVFPGRPGGSTTERLAHLVGEELLRSADVLVDLHTSSPDTDMPLFAGCLDDGSAAANRAVELALAFGAPMVWTHPRLGPGRTLTMARDLGIPAIYVESPVGGVLDAGYLQAYVSGVRGVLVALAMLDDAPVGETLSLWVHGDGDADAISQVTIGGMFRADVALLDRVEVGQIVGTVVDSRARPLEQVHAAHTGHVVILRRLARVSPGTPVAGIAPARPELLGLPSDRLVRTSGACRLSAKGGGA
ncbi:hypothetical protein G1H11_21265 [Phytoactinopolyspora alkaliphila]|uniref:Succinylglutamate desuccinylase/Aspartoacylase catalytic domain-containing protein n=1 Tax=Phytoactinopolyspora alkaliphila TaxID=1783498 RepID=A0A6N9YS29_9ACTN|nr:M14 family metallopeptidase [Phytoactinopolyspora alkaliphila]NED97833.1 hypothetical protein [Phytoactinopolyspora alkaliphila]